MIVEDNFPFRQMVKGRLLSEFPSMEVIEAGNGEEAFKGLASYPIDLVFMDIGLSGENGLELTREIKPNYKDVTIAMLTIYDLPEYREAATQCGADCFIVKDSIKWDQISVMVKCFQRAKDSGGLKPSCVRLASEGLPISSVNQVPFGD
jgi:DNA-binding NarL/FixJ family response regulator